jgi:DNA-binding response OmpR family regulator
VTTETLFRDAAARIRAGMVDLLVADVRLGDFNGLHLGVLARHRGDTRVVLVSRRVDVGLRADAMRLGMLYLVKPFSSAVFFEAIGRSRPLPRRRPLVRAAASSSVSRLPL